MKTPTTKLIFTAVAATLLSLGARADTANTVKVTKFHQSYPYSGKATIEYTVGGTLPDNAIAEFTISMDDTSATFTQKGIVTGANTNVIDFASSFCGALILTNASFVVTIAEGEQGDSGETLGGVQLWENGPYWAECNMGATSPEEYGYYFWWGDTVGYTRSGGTTWVSSMGEQMINSPFVPSKCPTYGKEKAELWSAGYTDKNKLVAGHDAATARLGTPWRMPTSDEIDALLSNCITTWITTNNVSGRLVTGKGDYANRSIFLPAAGYGSDSNLNDTGLNGYYLSSEPSSESATQAQDLYFSSSEIIRSTNFRAFGQSVRPVRDAE